MISGVFRIQWYENSVRAETQTRWRALPSAAKKAEIMRGVPLSKSGRGNVTGWFRWDSIFTTF